MTRTDEQRAAHAAAMREWRRKNPDAAKAIDGRRRAAVNADPDRLERHRAYRRTAQAKWRNEHPEARSAIARKSEMLRRFGMTVAEYDTRLAEQGGVCAICGRSPTAKKRLCVDHDQATGRVRGLLCDHCNRGIGLLGDTRASLERALAYLGKWVTA